MFGTQEALQSSFVCLSNHHCQRTPLGGRCTILRQPPGCHGAQVHSNALQPIHQAFLVTPQGDTVLKALRLSWLQAAQRGMKPGDVLHLVGSHDAPPGTESSMDTAHMRSALR